MPDITKRIVKKEPAKKPAVGELTKKMLTPVRAGKLKVKR